MTEGSDHHRIKYEVIDYLEKNGWEAYVEKEIQLYGSPITNLRSRIWVDVFAIKDGKTYVCEVGQVSGSDRINYLRKVFDVVGHLKLDRRPYRYLNRQNWEKVQKVQLCLGQRDVFGDRPYRLEKELETEKPLTV